MKGTLLKLGLLAAATMLPAGAAEVNHSWETLVQTLKPGKTVVVTQMNGNRAEGNLCRFRQEAIAVMDSGQPVSIQREDVFRVRSPTFAGGTRCWAWPSARASWRYLGPVG